ncbi:MAG: hypothetical protein Q9M40_07125 [Sulfurimonas sp.]|nr:hypothetical protein [Sulfurimonas sp.]
MQDIDKKPLVDVLSEQLGEQVVMSGENYVYMIGLLPVSRADVDVARLEQNNPKVIIPVQVTMRQARLALLQSGLLTTIESSIVNGTDEAMKIEWGICY